MKRCLKSLVIREMQIKTTRYLFTAARMCQTKRTDSSGCWWWCGEFRNRHTLLVECKIVQPLRKSLAVSQKVKHGVTIWPSASTPRCVPERMENIGLHRDFYMNVHRSIIHNSLKVAAAQCPSADEWTNKRRSVHTMENYLAYNKEQSTAVWYHMDEP